MRQKVYVIWNPEVRRTKIGISNNVAKRLDALMTSAGCKMEIVYESDFLPNAFIYESKGHDHFKDYRYIGEWFGINYKEVVEYIESIIPNNKFNVDNIKKMIEDGNNITSISNYFNVSRQSVYNKLDEANLNYKSIVNRIERGEKPGEMKYNKVKLHPECTKSKYNNKLTSAFKRDRKIDKYLYSDSNCFIIEKWYNGELIREKFDTEEEARERLSLLT